ncbi:hypothetical protein G6F57_001691 [Rhizopus arrhizus]|nr:hypothetical protein G6F30_002702 [Rhizopus arrhizus]KAG1427738.1 hypothetical protein G6F58_000889 [Rhizopus delemar]KAG0986986.1 hypothetical protein G6F29_002852 [Rhizopus arrhizus]KAG0998908.1 hypothetical protein G6F28_001507 [Rhizopus arrhizus]KAG1014135.1 hypothetical protein G6F27_001253 [Rhizopus arrhizus]
MEPTAIYNQYRPPMLPAGWIEYRAPTGQPYWYNTITRQSTWSFPAQQQQQPPPPKKKQIKKKIPGTRWLFVLTYDGYEFYYDRETKTSVWEMPSELKEPMKELERVEQEEKIQKRKLEEEENEEKAKKMKLEQEREVAATEMTEEDIMWQLEQMGAGEEEIEKEEKKIIKKQQKPIEIDQVEVKPVEIKEKNKKDEMPEQERIAKFYELLKERNISPFAVYSIEHPILSTDPRFTLVPSHKQKALFNKYCHELGEQLKNQQKNKKKPEEEFMELLESKVTEKIYFDDFRRKCKDDPRFKAIPTTREREGLFKDYIKNHLGKKKNPVEDYVRLLRETKEIQPGIRWRDAKKILERDERYHAIESKMEREDLFRDYLETLV